MQAHILRVNNARLPTARLASWRAWVLGLGLVGGCSREAVPMNGEVIPLVPASARPVLDAGAARGPERPRTRVVRYAVRRQGALSGPEAGLDDALLARARALDALDARVLHSNGETLVELTLPFVAMQELVRDQLGRTGRFSLAVLDLACEPRRDMRVPPPGIEFTEFRVLGFERWVFSLQARSDPGTGIAPLEPLRSIAARLTVEPGRRVLLGPVRERNRGRDNGVARRAWCVFDADALRSPAFDEARPTLDPTSLEPVLELRVAAPSQRAVRELYARAHERPVLAVIDDEVIGPVTVVEERDAPTLRVLPLARVGSVSPELVGALLRSGALPVPIQLTELAPEPARPAP